jgi:hypothetical protein
MRMDWIPAPLAPRDGADGEAVFWLLPPPHPWGWSSLGGRDSARGARMEDGHEGRRRGRTRGARRVDDR